MATCIRCGSPCKDGETMCDNCKAWFQQKTGGTTPGGSQPSGSSAQQITPQGTPDGPKKKSGMKNVGIVAAIVAVIAIIAGVAFVVVSTFGEKMGNVAQTESTDIDKSAEEKEVAEKETTEELPKAETVESEEENKQDSHASDAAVDAEVRYLQQLYSSQQKSYSNSRICESARMSNQTFYYLNDDLVEADVANTQGAAGYSVEYNFSEGKLYYAKVYKDSGATNVLYFKNDELIRWVDADGNIHDKEFDSAAYNEWYDYQSEGYKIYYKYSTPRSAGLDNTTDYTHYTYYNSEFVFADSDCVYLSESDLYGLSAWELRIARNEIMARHGRRFNDEELQRYFNSCSWYFGTIEPSDFDKNYNKVLNKYETKNANVIKKYEKKMGYIK